jgi:F1F0 ATPase subunit 2
MSELVALAAAAVAGVALGAAFFAGLWWTVRKGLGAQRPALWFFGSLMLRSGLAAAGFYLVGRGHWERMAACLAGFAAARWFMTARFGESARHAP